MGPVAFVFDLSDTVVTDPLAPPLPEAVLNPFPARGQPPAKALPNIGAACAELGIEITEQDFATGQAGCVHGFPGGYRVILNLKHSPAQQLGTLAHELGHVFCGHLGKMELGFWPDRSPLEKKAEEFEAEAVAYLVTDRMALDIASEAYLSGYLKDDQPLPNYSLDAVLKAAGKVEEMVAGRFHLKQKAKKP